MKRIELEKLIERIVRKQLKEETGLNTNFDKVISTYKELMIEKQKMMKDFVDKFKAETDPKEKEKLKNGHLQRMKEFDKKFLDAELKYKAAIQNLETATEKELY
jgi:Fic family protein